MKIAFLFVGQGSQKVGMGKEVYAAYACTRALFDGVKTDFDLKQITFEGPEAILNDTAYTQVCLLVTSLAIAQALNEEGIKAEAVAGLSLGEYSALTYAQALPLDQAIALVMQRGLIMASALPIGTSSMSAVLSDQLELIRNAVAENKNGIVEIANYNSPQQFVLSGEVDALHQVENTLKAQGINRIIPLKVSGAFHSSLLNNASNDLNNCLNQVTWHLPQIPVYYNFSGQIETDIIKALTLQICHSVQWTKTIQNMISDGYDTFIEIGPGKTLANLVKQINDEVTVYSAESVASIQKIKGELKHE